MLDQKWFLLVSAYLKKPTTIMTDAWDMPPKTKHHPIYLECWNELYQINIFLWFFLQYSFLISKWTMPTHRIYPTSWPARRPGWAKRTKRLSIARDTTVISISIIVSMDTELQIHHRFIDKIPLLLNVGI